MEDGQQQAISERQVTKQVDRTCSQSQARASISCHGWTKAELGINVAAVDKARPGHASSSELRLVEPGPRKHDQGAAHAAMPWYASTRVSRMEQSTAEGGNNIAADDRAEPGQASSSELQLMEQGHGGYDQRPNTF